MHAVAAEHRPGLARDRDGLARVVELADRDLVRLQRAGVFQPPELQREQEALVDLERHVDELLLRELVRRDGLAEHLTPLRVGERRAVAVERGAHDAPDDAVARLVEARERAAQPLGTG